MDWVFRVTKFFQLPYVTITKKALKRKDVLQVYKKKTEFSLMAATNVLISESAL